MVVWGFSPQPQILEIMNQYESRFHVGPYPNYKDGFETTMDLNEKQAQELEPYGKGEWRRYPSIPLSQVLTGNNPTPVTIRGCALGTLLQYREH